MIPPRASPGWRRRGDFYCCCLLGGEDFLDRETDGVLAAEGTARLAVLEVLGDGGIGTAREGHVADFLAELAGVLDVEVNELGNLFALQAPGADVDEQRAAQGSVLAGHHVVQRRGE